MNRSKNAAHYGRLAEEAAAERYDLDLDGNHSSWHDALDPAGDPFEIKAAMRKRANGQPGRFRIFEQSHQQLAKADGSYVFTAYIPRGTGIEIAAMKSIRARALRLGSSDFVSAGTHRDGRQIRIPISRIF